MRELLVTLGIAKVVEVPVVSRGRAIGGIVLYHHQHRSYQPYELELLETFAEQLGGGIGLAQAYDAVNALDQQREEFLALVSHDLRQPVVAISIVAEALAANTRLSDVERRSLDGLLDQARSLARFADDVLTVSLAESGQFKLRPVQFDLGLLVAGLARQALQARRIELDVTEEPLFVDGDPDRIAQAIENLLHNAFKYSAPETSVILRVRPNGDQVLVEVCDAGIGLDPEDMRDLFQKYGRPRLDATRGQASFGLGLYLCRLLVETHGGAISAHSEGRGHGATFRIALPLESGIPSTSLVTEAA
jgi:signal transduction histidine kinase